MTATSLAELKKRQQQRRKQQQKDKAGTNGKEVAQLKRKHAEDDHKSSDKKPATIKQRTLTALFAPSNKSTASSKKASQNMFAALPRTLPSNPFDIIRKEIDNDVVDDAIVVGATGNISDEDYDMESTQVESVFGRDIEEESDGECEYDPSMYTLSQRRRSFEAEMQDQPVIQSATLPNRNTSNEKKQDKIADTQTKTTVVAETAGSQPKEVLRTFERPPESLSMRTHVSITSEIALDELSELGDASSFLALTQLCHHKGISSETSLGRIADALTYWEVLGSKLPSDKPIKPAGNATVAQIQESLSSLFSLQRLAPSSYPFIYACLRDFTVIFKMMPLGDTNEYKRVAVISQSYLGLRRALRNAEVEFSLPLAPKLRSWNEIQHTGDNKADQLEDRHHLQSTTVDKTWRSALLVMGAESVDRVLSYLISIDTLDTAQIFSTKPFVNGTMRKAEIRFSNALSYEDGTDSGGKPQRQEKSLYKADFRGIILPNAWHAVLVAMSEFDKMSATGFVVASKERFETVHLNMLVSKQGSAVAGKRNVEYVNRRYTYY